MASIPDTSTHLHPNSVPSGKQATFFANKTGTSMSVTAAPGGAYVTFYLGSPDQETLVSGLLKLAWAPQGGVAAIALATAPAAHVVTAAQIAAQRRNEVEEPINRAVSSLPPNTKAQIRTLNMPRRFRVNIPVQLVERPVPPKPTHAPRVRSVPDYRKTQRKLMRAHLLCQATNNVVPDVPPAACQEAMRQQILNTPTIVPRHPLNPNPHSPN